MGGAVTRESRVRSCRGRHHTDRQPGARSLMTLGMCRDPLHRPLKQPGRRVAARPPPGRNLPRTCVCQLTPQQKPHRKGAGKFRRVATPLFTSATGSYLWATVDEPAGAPVPARLACQPLCEVTAAAQTGSHPAPRPGVCLVGLFVSPARCSQADAARVALPPCAARAAQPSTLPPRRLHPPAGQGLRCSARAVAVTPNPAVR